MYLVDLYRSNIRSEGYLKALGTHLGNLGCEFCSVLAVRDTQRWDL